MGNNSNKVIVLGLDGASWTILTPLMRDGHMPNLLKLCNEGAYGTLLSTTPPFTAPAWVSCVTGVNPGKHGVFGFKEKTNGNKHKVLISSNSVKVNKIWNYLSDAGKVVGMINIPVTYPAEKVNGFMVPCFLTPKGKNDFTYPAVLYEELINKIGSYVINVKIAGRRINAESEFHVFIDELIFALKKRFEAMNMLKVKYAPDFLMVVFTCLDKIQHKFWKYLDYESDAYHSLHAKKIRQKLKQVYQLVDNIIGTIMDNMDRDTTLYIVSDHGFGPLRKRVFMNQWLLQEGFLTIRSIKFIFNSLVSRSNLIKSVFSRRNIAVGDNLFEGCINSAKTTFYSSDVYEQGIYFNDHTHLPKDNYEQVCRELRDKLLGLRDPDTGEQFVDDVFYRKDLYKGPYVSNAPDLLLRMNHYSYMLNKSLPLRKKNVLRDVNGPDGCHRSEGIVIAYGKNIQKQSNIHASIMDITPTILFNMNMPVPDEMDGNVMKDIFTAEFKSFTRLRYYEDNIYKPEPDNKNSGYHENEENEIKSHLRELGYFD